jgi:hypothetical protein
MPDYRARKLYQLVMFPSSLLVTSVLCVYGNRYCNRANYGIQPADQPAKIQQWNSFVDDVAFQPGSLTEEIRDLAAFLMPHAAAARGLDRAVSA